MIASYYTRNLCRVCGNRHLFPYLDLGNMPLANNLEDTSEKALHAQRYPLQVAFCDICKLSQLTHVVDPEVLFKYYTYRSSINDGYKKHCRELAEYLIENDYMNTLSFVIDIAGNDGALLNEFRNAYNEERPSKLNMLNIDPAENLCQIAEEKEIKSIPVFWNSKTAIDVINNYGFSEVIISTNVFAHVDDIKDFILGIKTALSENGVWILEFPYLVDLIERNEFDTVYFEHVSYLSIHPVKYLCDEVGLKICNIEKFSIHGGTVRLTISHNGSYHTVQDSVNEYLQREINEGYTSKEKYSKWSSEVYWMMHEFTEQLLDIKRSGKKIASFAASAKGNTLLNSSRITNKTIDYIIDETPEKIGKFYPGTGIPIVDIKEIERNKPDYVVVLSWNFKEEIIEKLKKIYSGKFIIPIPKFEIC